VLILAYKTVRLVVLVRFLGQPILNNDILLVLVGNRLLQLLVSLRQFRLQVCVQCDLLAFLLAANT
jgi:hypothetical protein